MARKETSEKQLDFGVSRSRVRWKKPEAEMVKLNLDAVYDSKQMRMGAGVVIRDEEGEVPVPLCMLKLKVCNAIEAEIHALWHAVKL